jgi:hypothetical protein
MTDDVPQFDDVAGQPRWFMQRIAKQLEHNEMQEHMKLATGGPMFRVEMVAQGVDYAKARRDELPEGDVRTMPAEQYAAELDRVRSGQASGKRSLEVAKQQREAREELARKSFELGMRNRSY